MNTNKHVEHHKRYCLVLLIAFMQTKFVAKFYLDFPVKFGKGSDFFAC